jgi:[amino group carrier protein]-lysine/ornithine hydrolase
MDSIPETLLGLVKIYSPSGNEPAAVGYLVDRMEALHFTRTFIDEAGNAVGIMGNGLYQIILLGHIDTVPGEIPVRVDSAAATSESSVLYGRGSVDAKGALAAFTDAVAAVGPVDDWQFVVIGAVDEEQDSLGARHVAAHYHPKFAIIGEPSRWDRVTLGYKGSTLVKVTVRRSLAHTAGQAESACEAAVRAWQAISEMAAKFNTKRERVFDRLQLSLRSMESGGDGFEEWANLSLGARLPLGLPPEDWFELLNAEPALSSIPGLSIERAGFPIPAYKAEKNNPLVRAFLAGIRAVGAQPGFVYKTGTADMNILAPAWGCPTLAYGPGDSALDHTPNENLSLAEYARAVEVIQSVLENLSQRK